MDWEDFWDTIRSISGILIFLIIVFGSSLLISNSYILSIENSPPVQYATINQTNYACTPNNYNYNMEFKWDFSYHKGSFFTYFFVTLTMLVAAMFMIGITMGYIPICGCGKC